MNRRSMALRLFLAAVALGGGSACGGGGGGAGAENPSFAVAPIGEDLNASEERALSAVTVSAVGLPAEVAVDDIVRFRVTARVRTPAALERITIALQNPPPGCVFLTATGTGGTFSVAGRWIVNAASAGPLRLAFRVISSSQGVFRRSFDVRVVNRLAPVTQAVYGGHGVLTGDVTGDGLLDVVALATSDGADDRGAVYVFAGSTQPSVSPTATLRDPSGAAGDRLGSAQVALPEVALVHLVDVTGDGVLDVVAACPRSDRGAPDAGAIFVWAGGPALVGEPVPNKVLQAPVPTASERLGASGLSSDPNPLLFADVTGSPARDIVIASRSGIDGGAIYVFEGGAALTGGVTGATVAPAARLLPPVGYAGEAIGTRLGALQAHDVTGDGREDLLASNGLLFAGGAGMVGVVVGTTLEVTPPGGVSLTIDTRTPALKFGDVTGDGIDDIVGDVGLSTTVDGVASAGLGCVWRGRASFTGAVPADHLLSVPTPQALDEQGSFVGYLLDDVTGDGVLDVVAPAPGDGVRPGELRLWKGGAIVGARPNPVRLRDAAGSRELGAPGLLFQSPIQFGDVTGDGLDDVVLAFPTALAPGASGCVLFVGGSNLDRAAGVTVLESAFLTTTVATEAIGTTGRHGVQLEDLDADGILDVIADASSPTTATSVGARVWKGRANPTGTIAPSAFLAAPMITPRVSTQASGSLANVAECMTLADLDRDGLPEVVLVVDASPGGATVPVAYVYGGATLFAQVPALTPIVLGDTQSGATSELNGLFGAHAPVQVADVTGDGRAEVIAGAPRSNATASAAGCVYLWDPSPTPPLFANPTSAPVHRLRAPRQAGLLFPTAARGPQGVLLCDFTGDGVVEVLVCNPLASAGDGDIGFLGGAVPFPTSTNGTSGRFFAGTSADGLTR